MPADSAVDESVALGPVNDPAEEPPVTLDHPPSLHKLAQKQVEFPDWACKSTFRSKTGRLSEGTLIAPCRIQCLQEQSSFRRDGRQFIIVSFSCAQDPAFAV
jgi:hypothetical protein